MICGRSRTVSHLSDICFPLINRFLALNCSRHSLDVCGTGIVVDIRTRSLLHVLSNFQFILALPVRLMFRPPFIEVCFIWPRD